MPSDMALHPDNVQGYNKLILIAGSDVAIGHTPVINEEPINSASEVVKAFQGKTAPPAGTVHKGSQPLPVAKGDDTSLLHLRQVCRAMGRRWPIKKKQTALVPAGIAVGLVALWLSSQLRQ